MSEQIKKILISKHSLIFKLQNDTYNPLLYSLNPHGLVIDNDSMPIISSAYDMDINFSKQRKFTPLHFDISTDIEKFLRENKSLKFSKIRISHPEGTFRDQNLCLPVLFTQKIGSKYENYMLNQSDYLSAYQFAGNIIDVELGEGIIVHSIPNRKNITIPSDIFNNNIFVSMIVLPKTAIHISFQLDDNNNILR